MGQFDQTARPLAKMDGAAFFVWAFSCCPSPPALTFQAWDDTRRLVSPGEPDRTNDLVSLCKDDTQPERPAWMIVEIEDEPERGILYRMGGYELLLGKEVNPNADPAGACVNSLLMNLTGTQAIPRLDWSRGSHGSAIAPYIANVAQQDALATLKRIENGELGLTILPFLALMVGGGTLEFIDLWKKAVVLEPEMSRRIAYRDSALILAELTPQQVNWLTATEGWMARESTLINSWLSEGKELGRLQNAREYLIRVIRRLENPVPESIRLAIEGTNDLATLDRWLDSAVTVETIAELRRAMKLDP